MKKLYFPKANGLTSECPIEPLEIHVTDALPPAVVDSNYMKQLFRGHAKNFVEAMLWHMPGGLVDEIFAELCSKKASLLVVPLKGKDSPC